MESMHFKRLQSLMHSLFKTDLESVGLIYRIQVLVLFPNAVESICNNLWFFAYPVINKDLTVTFDSSS
jgi:hypothetical protein